MKHKKLFISLTAIFTVVVFFAIFLMIWFLGDNYKDFESFNQEFEIPGLKDGAVPQGMATCQANYYVEDDAEGKPNKAQQYFFISSYMMDGSPSRIYVTGADTGYVGYVTLKTEDGKDFFGHCGGIAINNGTNVSKTSATYYTLWVTGESMVYCAKASEEYVEAGKSIAQEIVEKAEQNGTIQITSSFKANCNASFCFYYDDPYYTSVTYDKLYIGEFYRAENYETDKKHWMTTPKGYQNTAFMYEYTVSSSAKYGLAILTSTNGLAEEDRVPRIQKIISLPEKIQGGAFSGRTRGSNNDGTLILSESYGLNNSHLLCFDYKTLIGTSRKYTEMTGESFVYDGVKKTFGNQQIDYTDNSLYVYFADKNDAAMLVNDYSIPSMTEGLCVPTPPTAGNGSYKRVYVLFESAGKKYKNFVREQIKDVYSFIPRSR